MSKCSLKIFILFSIVLLCRTASLRAQHQNILALPVSITASPDSLIKVLGFLELKTKINFAFDPDQLRKKRTVALRLKNVPLHLALDQILMGVGLGYKLVGNDIVIAPVKQVLWTINGHVKDQSNGEELIGATVSIPNLEAGVITNQYGFYSISVPAGDYTVIISNSGYLNKEVNIHLDKDITQEIDLVLKTNRLEEVVIRQINVTPNPLLLNEQNFTAIQLNSASYYAGEVDVVKRLQMQNGVKAISEGSSGLFVRGGNADQNLILLDEATVYNPSHLYGLVSIFNSDAVNNVQVYQDYIPANFGGRLSSVIVNRMAEGNNKEYHLNGGINLMSAKLAAEGPIVKDKGSFIVAFRRSLLDVFQTQFKLFNPRSVYYDLNAKANFKPDKNNALFYSVYLGRDNLLSDDSYANNWGNLTSTLRWNHIFNAKVFLNVSAIYSNYSNRLDLNADTLSQKTQWDTGVKDLTLKADFTYYRSPVNQIKFGLSGIYHLFTPGEVDGTPSNEFNIPRDKSLETAIYYSQQITLNSFELNYGARFSLFRNMHELKNVFDDKGNRLEVNEVKTYARPEPRLNISYLPDEHQRIFVTYNRNYQYLQLIQNSTLAFSSLEPWVSASGSIRPQSSDYFSLGYRYAGMNKYNLSFSTYYKKLDHQLELVGHAQIINNPDIRNQLRAGKSNAYGVEVELNKTEGRFSGTVAYTYARVFRKIADVNYGAEFPANYDVPHELKATLKYDWNKHLSFQSFFTYATGRPLTLPVGYYQQDGLNVPIFEGRNTSRFPDFSRLDISAQYQFSSKFSGKRRLNSSISIGTYNLYNRKNPLYYHLSSSSFEPRSSSIIYAFGFYPWIAYSFKI